MEPNSLILQAFDGYQMGISALEGQRDVFVCFFIFTINLLKFLATIMCLALLKSLSIV